MKEGYLIMIYEGHKNNIYPKIYLDKKEAKNKALQLANGKAKKYNDALIASSKNFDGYFVIADVNEDLIVESIYATIGIISAPIKD